MNDLKHFLEAMSLISAVTTCASWIAGALPPMAAFLSMAWIAFQFYHSEPMRARRARKMKEEDES